MKSPGLPTPAGAPPWPRLVHYYRSCLEHERMDRLQVTIETGGYALLDNLTDTIIAAGADSVRLTHPSHIQRARQLAARLRAQGQTTCGYGYPIIKSGRHFIPLCYTVVTLEASPDQGVLITRTGDDLLINRRLLKEDADLSDREIAELVKAIGQGRGPSLPRIVSEYLDPESVVFSGLLFAMEPDSMTTGLARDLDWMGKQPTSKLSAPLKAYLGYMPAKATATRGDQEFATAVRSNPAQNDVLRGRDSTLQVVAGPPGTGKTQTIINLITSALADGRSVLFISKNNKAVDNVYDDFQRLDLFPGILRLGERGRRQEALRKARALLQAEILPSLVKLEDLARESIRLAGELNRMETAIIQTERRLHEQAEAIELQQQAEEILRSRIAYRWARDRATQIDHTNAARFTGKQMAGLRYISALIAGWEDEPTGFDRVLKWVRLLEPLRVRRLRSAIGRLGLPAPIRVEGASLVHLTNAVLDAELSYPYLYATARRRLIEHQVEASPSVDEIKTQRDTISDAKLQNDRRLLHALWQIKLGRSRLKAAEIDEALALEEQMAEGAHLEKENWLQRGERFKSILSLFPVICCTNLSLAASVPNQIPELFDLVILDEASQSDIASLLPALYRAKRACIVGDDQQLRHISSIDLARDLQLMQATGLNGAESFRYSDHSAFDRACRAVGHEQVRLLNRHYRCVPDIIQFCNEEFYGGRLRVEREHPAEPGGDLPLYGFCLDDVSSGRTVYAASRSGTSATNEDEARRVVWLIEQYVERGVTDIGVVTPFRGQRQLIAEMLLAAADEASEPHLKDGLRAVEVGTIHTFQGGQRQVMLFSTVVAAGARSGTIDWFGQNGNLVNVALSRAKDLLLLVCHRDTLLGAEGILQRMAAYAEHPYHLRGTGRQLPPGLQPARFGLRPDERDVLAEWLSPAAVLEVLNPGERELYDRLVRLCAGRPVWISPKVRGLDILDVQRLEQVEGRERDYAFRAHFDLVVIDSQSLRPVAVVELDGRQHEADALTQARDRLKDGLCHKAGLPLIRVRWGDWGALEGIVGLLGRGT